MKVTTKRNSVWVWLSALILFVFVAASVIVLYDRLDSFLLDDSGAISLINDDPQLIENNAGAAGNSKPGDSANKNNAGSMNGGTKEYSNQPGVGKIIVDPKPTDPSGSSGSASASNPSSGSNSGSASNPGSSASSASSQSSQSSWNPGFEAGDEKGVWGTQTQVDIFRVSYENGEQAVTVNSDNGDKLIAPGTENSYTFKLKNTGNVALDYTVELDAYITPADIYIPIRGRLNRYDGTWIVGDRDRYEAVSVLDTASDKATLGAGKYTYYTLDWQWPFESGDDPWDTHLGNLAVDQDLVFTIVIRTRAEANTDPGSGGGITPPYTGDDSNLTLWIVLAASSFVIMLLLLSYRNGEKKQQDAEAEKR